MKKTFWKRKENPTLAKSIKRNPAPSSHVNTVVKYNKKKARGKNKEKKNMTGLKGNSLDKCRP
jgi:hypothetical protein